MVSEYKQSCGYSVGALKDFIYLIPYGADRFSYSIDNGMCSEVGMNSTLGIVRINGFQATLKNTETIEGRFKYESEVDIYVHELLGKNLYDRLRYLIENKWFVVVEDMQGIQYIQSVEFYSEFGYNISLTDQNSAQNRIQLQFKGSSNFPTMIMGSNINEGIASVLFSNDCRYIQGGISDFKMCDYQYVILKHSNHEVSKISTTGGYKFSDVEFTPKTFTYTQSYSDGQFEDTITFSIPLSDYKYYWHYNLIEFKDNRYVLTFRTANDNMYIVGYHNGATCTYVIETSTAAATQNKITITLKYIGSEGFYIASGDDSIFDTDTSIEWRPANDVVDGVYTKVCQNNGQAYITLIQKYTASGTPLDEFYVLEGYTDRYPTTNIVGVYSITDDFGFPLVIDYPSCIGGLCNTENSISNPYNFSASTPSHSFDFTTDCGFTLSGVPNWITLEQNGSSFYMSLSTELPDESTSATFYIKTVDGASYPVICNYTDSRDLTDWDVYPRSKDITHDAQNVTYTYTGNVTASDLEFSSESLSLVSVGNNAIIVKVSENTTTREIYYYFTITNKSNGESVELEVHQYPAGEEDWRTVGGYYCENGNKYTKLQLYVNGTPTQTFKAGELIETGSSDCDQSLTRWNQYDTICQGVDEYAMLMEQKSTDGGVTWTDTGNIKMGSLVEADSEKCDSEHVKWVNTGETQCNNGYLCEIWEKTFDGEATGETKLDNCVLDTTTCPTEYPTKWELSEKTQCVDRGDGICDSWYLNEEFISYDGGTTWESLGVYAVSSTMALKDDYDCNCDKHDRYRYERWVWDGIGYLCEDDDLNCTVHIIWTPYGFDEDKHQWTTKTITELEAPCDFTKFTDASYMFKDCGSLTYIETLDGSAITNMTGIFYNCTSLATLPFKNLVNVTGAGAAFYNCKKLTGSYTIAMPNLTAAKNMFYGSGITGWDFEGWKTPHSIVGIEYGSNLTSLKGIDYMYVTEDDDSSTYMQSSLLTTLEIKNIKTDIWFIGLHNLSKDSVDYMYNNANSSATMTWVYDSKNLAKWGSLPSGKSNITWVKNG